jgi:ribonuclease D
MKTYTEEQMNCLRAIYNVKDRIAKLKNITLSASHAIIFNNENRILNERLIKANKLGLTEEDFNFYKENHWTEHLEAEMQTEYREKCYIALKYIQNDM